MSLLYRLLESLRQALTPLPDVFESLPDRLKDQLDAEVDDDTILRQASSTSDEYFTPCGSEEGVLLHSYRNGEKLDVVTPGASCNGRKACPPIDVEFGNYGTGGHLQMTTPLCGKNNLNKAITFRSLDQRDRVAVQKLHEDWFPVVYTDAFYDGLVEHRLCDAPPPVDAPPPDALSPDTTPAHPPPPEGSEQSPEKIDNLGGVEDGALLEDPENLKTSDARLNKLYSCVAVEKWDRTGRGNCTGGRSGAPPQHGEGCCVREDTKIERDDACDKIVPTEHINVLAEDVNERLVGCAVSKFVRTVDCNDGGLIASPSRHPLLLYILTLGTVSDMRGRGLGSELIKRTEEIARRTPECGAIYLHVITYNKAAIHLYERLGFQRIREIEEYYFINETKYNCYLYAKHTNDGCLSTTGFIYFYLQKFVSSYWNDIKNNFQILSAIQNSENSSIGHLIQ